MFRNILKHATNKHFTRAVHSKASILAKGSFASKPIPTTSNLNFIIQKDPIPAYQILELSGKVKDPAQEPKLGKEQAIKMYKDMLTMNSLDIILYEIQRQGRISFYMTCFGEEGTLIGSAAALHKDDVIFGQYREAGVLLYRGFTIEDFMNQCFSNDLDVGKGRQMPVHYGSTELNFHTISSPLGTQIPQASGAAYALKREGKKNCVICYFGEGAASEGDFHAALNFASTTDSPVIFLCRNNGFAISTPTEDQYRGDGIVSRGTGYGIDSIRVDGNDVLGVYNVVKAAREHAINKNRPVLIEAMSYRIGHHSTSDDSSAYRSREEVEAQRQIDPIKRFKKYLELKGWWTKEEEVLHKDMVKKQIREALAKAEVLKKPPLADIFNDVYDQLTPALKEQKEELRAHLEKYPQKYPSNFGPL